MTDMSWGRIATWALRLMLTAVLVPIAFAAVVLTVIPRATHGQAMTVLTGSMSPTIPVGSVVLVQPVDPGTLHVGDIATYQKEPGKAEFITHRIIGVDASTQPASFTFKGDANRGPDIKPVPATAIRGKVLFHVPYLGTLRNAIGAGGVGLLLLMVVLAGYALVQLGSWLRERRAGPPVTYATRVDADGAAAPGLSLQLLVATFPIREFDGLQPDRVAALLRADLIDVNADQFTIAIAGGRDQLDEVTHNLLPFKPIELQRSDVVTVQPCGVAVDDAEKNAVPLEGSHVRA